MNKQQAIELSESHWWEYSTPREIASFQMNEERLCCPFGVFHKAVEETLGRPVFTHEFGLNRDGMLAELNGEGPPPSMEDIINMIPAEKRVIIIDTARGEVTP